ncbi:MAG: ATP-binding cassette domain-containing protein [Sedimentisphaerales bacterium]|nr:ATP-binding cassette domain-containing protein [Sedimentisphaerales bacterium]
MVSALVVAVLLSLSFITVIPLLKVMMGKEGLHGWVDRKTCQYRYGLDFYVPESVDFTSQENQGIAYYLLVVDVEKGSLGEAAGLRPADRIIGVGDLLTTDQVDQIPFTELLRELAAADQNDLDVQLKRLNTENVLERRTLKLSTPNNRSAAANLKEGHFERSKRDMKIRLTEHAQWAVGFLPREQTSESKIRAVIFIMLAMGLLTIIRCTAKFYQGYLAEKIVQVGVNHLREDVFAHLMDMPMSFFSKERPTDSVSRIIRDTSVMGQAIKIMLGKALREPLNALFMLAFAMLLNWQLALIFLGSAPFVLVTMNAFGKRMKRATKKLLMASSQMLSKLQETMAGLKVVKVYNQQQYEVNSFRVINDRLLKQLLKISKVDAATSPVLEVLGMAAGASAIIVGMAWVTHGRIDSPEFLTLLLLLGASAEAVRKTSDIWNKIQEARAAAERVFAIVDEPVEFEKPCALELPPLKRKIEFKNIIFTYPGGSVPVLKGVNLAVQAGHNVAIVGPNGSGKTTLANLLPRFYDPDSGQILIDGTDIHDVTLPSLRRQIGMVTQNMVTFHDTIAANIGYGKPDADREEIIAASKRAFAHEFIDPLPNGYDTLIGELSTGLSGGQLQRIVIARAILKNPAILIFDEATSQVDADSEAKIHKAIEEVMQDRTSFIIAHRFSTVISADVIVVMDQGRIIAQGRHDELIKTCSLYHSLYETQLVKG